MSLPGLARDTVVVKRPGAAVDAEGNPTKVLTSVSTAAGTWGSPKYRDLQRAAQLGQQIDAVVAYDLNVAPDVHVGDQVTVKGKVHTAVAVGDTQLTRRVLLRRSE